MKYIIIILSIMLIGCEKSHQEDLYPQIIYPDYYLSFSGVGIDIDNMKNTDLRTAMFNGSEVGYKASWETDTFMIRMFIIGDSLPYHAAGRIGETTFIIMMEESTMNICNGSQRVPVNITIKRDSTVLQ